MDNLAGAGVGGIVLILHAGIHQIQVLTHLGLFRHCRADHHELGAVACQPLCRSSLIVVDRVGYSLRLGELGIEGIVLGDGHGEGEGLLHAALLVEPADEHMAVLFGVRRRSGQGVFHDVLLHAFVAVVGV